MLLYSLYIFATGTSEPNDPIRAIHCQYQFKIASLHAQIASLYTELSEIGRVSALTLQQPAIQQTEQFPNTQAEINDLMNQLKTGQEERDQAQERIVELRADVTTTRVKNMELETLLEEAQINLAKVLMTIETQKNELETSQIKSTIQTDLENQIQALKDQLKASQSNLQLAKVATKTAQATTEKNHQEALVQKNNELEKLKKALETFQSRHEELKTQTQRREIETVKTLIIPILKFHIINHRQTEIILVLNHYKNNAEALKLLMDILKINTFYIRWNETQAKALLSLCTNEENLKMIENLLASINVTENIKLKKIETLMNKVDLFKTPALLTALYYSYPSHKMTHVIEQVCKYLSSKLSKEKLATYDESFTEALPILYLLGKTFGNFTKHKAKLTFIYETVFNLPNAATKSEKQLWLTMMHEEFIKKNLSLSQNKQENEATQKIQKLLSRILSNTNNDFDGMTLFKIVQNKGVLVSMNTFFHILFPTDPKAEEEESETASATPSKPTGKNTPKTISKDEKLLQEVENQQTCEWDEDQKTFTTLQNNNGIIQILQKYKNAPEYLQSLSHILKDNALYLDWTPAQAKQLLEIFATQKSLKMIDKFNPPKSYLEGDIEAQEAAQALRNEIDLFKNPIVLAALYYAYPAEKLIPIIHSTIAFLFSLPGEEFFNYDNDFLNAIPFLYLLGQTSNDFNTLSLALATIFELTLGILTNEIFEEKQLWVTLLIPKFSLENSSESEEAKELIGRVINRFFDTYQIAMMPSSEPSVIIPALCTKMRERGFSLPDKVFYQTLFPSVAITPNP